MLQRFFILTMLLIGSMAMAQDPNPLLARNYLEQGEYEKALSIYKKIYEVNPNNVSTMYLLIEVYQEMERYTAIDSLLDGMLARRKMMKQLLVDKGYNENLKGNDSLALAFYQEAKIAIEEKPSLAYSVAVRFQSYSLLDDAVYAYSRGMELNERSNYHQQLAQIYGEQGKMNLMFEKYLDLIESNPNYRPRAQAIFARHISDDPDGSANIALRKTLLKRSRENPDNLYNSMLSWLFIQQGDYKKAFVQEKAIYLRSLETTQGIQNIATIALQQEDYDAAKEILSYIVEVAPDLETKAQAQGFLLRIDSKELPKEEWNALEQRYQEYFSKYGMDGRTLYSQIDYAHFLAFRKGETEKGISQLTRLLDNRLNKYDKARVKIKLADILVLEERFNRALIYYSQVTNDLPNDALAQEAQFKVAKTSYFKGDFDWALTQLDVLRASSSKLIANDAMELSLLIKDNQEDTTYVALNAFAKAELKQYQNQTQEAIAQYGDILLNYKGDTIEDEALLRQAQLYEDIGQYDKAITNYQKIIDYYGDGILADDAYYALGMIYYGVLEEPKLAQDNFERILFDHADSIHFVKSRQLFRRLRGDNLNTSS